MPFDRAGAKAAGYSDQEIDQYLSSKGSPVLGPAVAALGDSASRVALQPEQPQTRVNVFGQPDPVGYFPTREDLGPLALALSGMALPEAYGAIRGMMGRGAGPAAEAVGEYAASKVPGVKEVKLLGRLFGKGAPAEAAETATGSAAARVPAGATAVPAPAASTAAEGAGAFSRPTVVTVSEHARALPSAAKEAANSAADAVPIKKGLKDIGKGLEWIKGHVPEELHPAAMKRYIKDNVPAQLQEAATAEMKRLLGT